MITTNRDQDDDDDDDDDVDDKKSKELKVAQTNKKTTLCNTAG